MCALHWLMRTRWRSFVARHRRSSRTRSARTRTDKTSFPSCFTFNKWPNVVWATNTLAWASCRGPGTRSDVIGRWTVHMHFG